MKWFCALLASLALSVAAAAGTYPDKPVRIVVPYSPGGGGDVVGRPLAAELGKQLGGSFFIDNRGGAGGNIGAALVAKAPPDGQTLLMASGSILTVNPHIYKDMGFDPQKDLAPITNIAQGPMLVVVNPKVPAHNLKELIALAKKEPGQLNFGSAGVGSQVHMAGENFADAAGIDIRHIPYKGEAMGLNDLMGGQVQLMVGNIAAATNFVKTGRLRALAVTSKERSPMMPDVPSAQEAGLPGFESVGWFGLMAPAGTPRAIIDKVQADTVKALQDPGVRKALADQGMVPVGNKPDEMARAVDDESKKWARVIAHRHLQTQ
jgi:tripartite-type tricarboxylate transporter receptor subunit TctC